MATFKEFLLLLCWIALALADYDHFVTVGHHPILSWWVLGGIALFFVLMLGLFWCLNSDGHHSYHGHRRGSHHHHSHRHGASASVTTSSAVGAPIFN